MIRIAAPAATWDKGTLSISFKQTNPISMNTANGASASGFCANEPTKARFNANNSHCLTGRDGSRVITTTAIIAKATNLRDASSMVREAGEVAASG